MRVDNTGNVGIGTTSPSSVLHVAKDNESVQLKLDATGTGSFNSIVSFRRDGTQQGVVGWDDSTQLLKLVPGDNIHTNKGLAIDSNGNVSIGTTSPNYTLHVNGTIGTTNSGQVHSDYVFEPGYKLRSLEELEDFIKEEQHLPGVITDPEKAPNVDLMSLNGKLLEKIEELTLYVIEQNKELKTLKEKVAKLEGNRPQ